jgi:hypothetical protein
MCGLRIAFNMLDKIRKQASIIAVFLKRLKQSVIIIITLSHRASFLPAKALQCAGIKSEDRISKKSCCIFQSRRSVGLNMFWLIS